MGGFPTIPKWFLFFFPTALGFPHDSVYNYMYIYIHAYYIIYIYSTFAYIYLENPWLNISYKHLCFSLISSPQIHGDNPQCFQKINRWRGSGSTLRATCTWRPGKALICPSFLPLVFCEAVKQSAFFGASGVPIVFQDVLGMAPPNFSTHHGFGNGRCLQQEI